MATVSGNKIKNSPENIQWYTYVSYNKTSATLYGKVEGIGGVTGHMWVRFKNPHIGDTPFTQQQGTYATGDVITLGSTTISQTSDTSFGATCDGGEWGQNGTSSGTIPAQTPPSGVYCSVSNITRDSAVLTGSVSSWGNTGATRQSETYEYGTTTSYGSTGSNLTNLIPFTTYYYRYTATNTNDLSTSVTGSFTTTGNNPVINSVATSPTRDECQFLVNVTYETNDAFGSMNIDYGTTTNYGSTSSSTTIGNLQPNTLYYYKVTIISQRGNSATYLGSFTTTGNAPTISDVSVSNLTSSSATITVTAIPDTNASINDYSFIIAVDSTTRIYSGASNVLQLNVNSGKTYTVTAEVTDNFNRTTTSSQVQFTVPGGFKINGCMVTEMKLNGRRVIGAKLNGHELL